MALEQKADKPWLPPRWFIRLAWSFHRVLYRVSDGRLGLRRPRPGRWGMLRLMTVGRRTGRERAVILAYFEDGDDLVLLAMNGWGRPEPAWWLNLRDHPEAGVEVVGGRRLVRAHAATGDERSRLWVRWHEYDPKLDTYAALRPTETAVVVLAPRSDGQDAT